MVFYGLAVTHRDSCIPCWKKTCEHIQAQCDASTRISNENDDKYEEVKESLNVLRAEMKRDKATIKRVKAELGREQVALKRAAGLIVHRKEIIEALHTKIRSIQPGVDLDVEKDLEDDIAEKTDDEDSDEVYQDPVIAGEEEEY